MHRDRPPVAHTDFLLLYTPLVRHQLGRDVHMRPTMNTTVVIIIPQRGDRGN